MEEISTLLLLSFTLLSVTLASPSILSNAADTLMGFGYLSMALTLRLASNTLHLDSPTATIFVPSDVAFLRSGQLPLSLLNFCARARQSPMADPFLLCCQIIRLVTKRPNSHSQLLINNVNVGNTAIFYDGSVIMLRIDEFFNSSSLVPESVQPPKPRSGSGNEPFGSVSDLLRSGGSSIAAAFLDAQLAELTDGTRFTVIAPADKAMVESVRNASDYWAIFRKHVVPRLLPWRELLRFEDETLYQLSRKGL